MENGKSSFWKPDISTASEKELREKFGGYSPWFYRIFWDKSSDLYMLCKVRIRCFPEAQGKPDATEVVTVLHRPTLTGISDALDIVMDSLKNEILPYCDEKGISVHEANRRKQLLIEALGKYQHEKQ